MKNTVWIILVSMSLCWSGCYDAIAQEKQLLAEEMLEKGMGYYIGKDYTDAAKWFKKAAEQGYAGAQYNLGIMYAKGEGVSQSEAEAVKWFERAAEQGVAEAQCCLGYAYANGEGVVRNKSEAIKWYRKAAEQGNAKAQHWLGVTYKYGLGVSKSDTEAVKWYLKAAKQGYAAAQYCLGCMYSNGQGISKNNAEAIKWYGKAAEQGNTNALERLQALQSQAKQTNNSISMSAKEINNRGIDYYNAKDYENALIWFKKAAEQGYVAAQYNLGIMYRNGKGLLIEDYANAIKWFEKAAKQGYSGAQYQLGYIYEFGREKHQDLVGAMLSGILGGNSELINYDEAIKWYLKAAEQGNAQAQSRLGIIYKEGKGVTKNLSTAKYWLQKAAENNNEEATIDTEGFLKD